MLQALVDLLFDPFLALGLVCLDVHVVEHCAHVAQRVNVLEELRHVVLDLLLVGVLHLQILFV